MAKASGMGDALLIDGNDLSGDVGSVQRIAAPSAVLDVTCIDKSAFERVLGTLDGAIEFNAFFNDASNQEHAVLKALADRVCSYLHGAAIGNMSAGLSAKQINYDPTRGADGSLAIAIQCLGSAYGLDYCKQLTAGKRTDTGATNGASLDEGAATSRGLSAYLQVTALTGTDITLTIQESSDDAAGDPFANVTGGAFTQVTASPAKQRIVTGLTLSVERYLRVVSSTSAGFTSCTFSVIVCRFPAM